MVQMTFVHPLNQGSPTSRPQNGILLDHQWHWVRNKVHNKCNVLESFQNHLPTPSPLSQSKEKLSSLKLVPGAKKD